MGDLVIILKTQGQYHVMLGDMQKYAIKNSVKHLFTKSEANLPCIAN